MNKYVPKDYFVDGVMFRECSRCKSSKPLNKENFRKLSKNINGFMYNCKDCKGITKASNKNSLPREEIDARDELNEYVRTKFFKYEDGVAVPRYFWNRVNGMITGNFCGGEKKLKDFKYTYRLMLYVFKYSESKILYCIDSMSFKDDAHFINTICKIAEKNIMNGLYRLKDDLEIKQRVQEEIDKAKETTDRTEEITYVKKTKLKKRNEHLW